MNTDQAYVCMRLGLSVRRPSWRKGYSMRINERGIEETQDASGNVLALGYRSFTCDDVLDFELADKIREIIKEK